MANSINVSKQEKLEKKKRMVNHLMLIPIVLLLAFVPLIIRVQKIYLDPATADALNTYSYIDKFSNYKATAIIVLSICSVITLFLTFDKEMIKKDKYIKVYAIGSGLFLIISLIATLFSDNKATAWWGIAGRSEGFIVTACYILILFYTILTFREYDNFKWIVAGLSVLVVISTILGLFQYFGKDLFTNVDFFKKMIMSKEQYSELESISGLIESKTIYGTMFHYNYMGSFAAMMVPLFMTLTLFIKNKKQKLVCGLTTLCSLFLLFGSSSRAGFIGFAFALVMGIIVFGKKLIKKWKIAIPIVIIMGVVVVGFNAVTGGTIFRRIPTLIHESIGLVSGSDESFDYKDHIPVRDIFNENGSVRIVFQQNALIINGNGTGFTFTDELGNEVVFAYADNQYITQDPRFINVTFIDVELYVPEGEVAPKVIRMYYQMDFGWQATFLFKQDSVEGVTLCDPYPIQTMEIDYPETIGFKGKERLGSARGYIWSRSIPMMRETFLIGYGPDTYAEKFPQNDLLGKWWAYDTPNMIIDKAHSVYLQYFINNGGLALLGFLVLVITYIVQSLRQYAFKGYYENKEIIGIATFLAIVGYLGAGIFNDSVVSVAPIFWILLGTGISINFLIDRDIRSNKARIKQKVINMKKK